MSSMIHTKFWKFLREKLGKNKSLDLLVLIAGLLTPLGFSPFGFWPIPIITLAVLLFSLDHQPISPMRALCRGFLFGLGFFGVGISWVYISIHEYGSVNIFLSLLITSCFIFYLALYPALTCYAYQKFFKPNLLLKTLFIFPAFWVISELLRSYLFTGFPWLDLGYAGINSPYAGMAPLWGVYGVSLCLLIAASLISLVFRTKGPKILIYLLVLILLTLFVQIIKNKSWTEISSKPVSMALIQGNISPNLKWNEGEELQIIQTYYQLTQSQLEQNKNIDLIIWPEDALPLFKSSAEPFLTLLNKDALTHHSSILLGLPIDQPNLNNPDNALAYNGALILGEGQGQYLKRHLVPFGEYTPDFFSNLTNLLNLPMSDFSKGPENQNLLQLQNINLNSKQNSKPTPVSLGLTICYESAFPLEFQKNMQGADLLISISDDAWFGRSLGAWQHLEMAQMRAKETGRYLIQDTNSGMTVIISPQGQILKFLTPYQAGILNGQVYAMKNQTPWMQAGIYPLLLLIFLMIAVTYCNRK